ncbi:MAG: NAD(P)H-binding protein [Cytophagales bacterium]|nr:NAD(P)H-binding protein [Rhizobacter sp.]
MSTVARTTLLAGSTGLIGQALLPLLLASPQYAQVHALQRREALAAQPKLKVHVVDFQALPSLPPVDDVFIALGTTIKVAGSKAAFRKVDFDAVVNTARAARAAGATRLAVVSALGADANSAVFYSRVKGEMQAAVGALGYDSVVIVQPSLLVGDRATLGQPVRAGEVWGARLMGWLPKSVRPIAAGQVAEAMLRALTAPPPGVTVLRSGELY